MITSEDVLRNFEIAKIEVPSKPPWFLPDLNVDTTLVDQIENSNHPFFTLSQCLEHLNEQYKEHTKIFTDGSKTSTGCGCSFLVENSDFLETFSLPSRTSIFSAELYAILQSLLWVKNNRHRKVAVFTDSLSALMAIKSHKSNNRIVADILDYFADTSFSEYEVTFVWIPAHVGIPGNEHADMMAKIAATGTSTQADIPLSLHEGRAVVKELCAKKWNEAYVASSTAKHYKALCPSTSTALNDKALSRRHSTILFRLSTGHCRLNSHLGKIGCVESEKCENCGVDETVQHFVLECPLYSDQRKTVLQTARALDITFDIYSLLRDNKTQKAVLEFVVATRREM